MLTKLISLLFPKKCLLCNKVTSEYGALCAPCWAQISFIQKPYCNNCGFPFRFDIGADLLCGNCIKKQPYFDEAFSLFKYDEHSKALIHKFKYGDKTYLSKYFAKWIFARLDATEINRYSYVTAVPLHRKRLRQRFFNQSALIAKELAVLLSDQQIVFMPNLLVKKRHDTPQTGLSKKSRYKNVKNSFAINKKYQSLVEGSNIIIIDDVYTTGTTLNECSKILKKNRCANVKAITVARV